MSYLPVFKRTYILQATSLTQLHQITNKMTIKTFVLKVVFFFLNNYFFIVLVEIWKLNLEYSFVSTHTMLEI